MEKIQHFFSGCQLKGTAHPIVISANIYNIDSGSNWWLTHFRITQRNIRNYTAYISLLTHTKTNFSWWFSTIYCVLFIKTVLERKLCRIHFAFVGLVRKNSAFLFTCYKKARSLSRGGGLNVSQKWRVLDLPNFKILSPYNCYVPGITSHNLT